MDFENVDRYLRWARSRMGIHPNVVDEMQSGVPCPTCGVKLRPVTYLSVAQAIAQYIFLRHVEECGCGEKGIAECDVALSLFRNLPIDLQYNSLGIKI